MKDKLVIGIIRTSHGVHGELKVKSFSGETEHFFKLEYIYLKGKEDFRQFRVEKIRITSNTILLKLEGINTPERGKELAGCKIWVNREDACPLEENEYYFGDLSQCRIMKQETTVGKVINLIETGSGFILEVEKTDKKRIMIPFSTDYIDTVDIIKSIIMVNNEAEIFF